MRIVTVEGVVEHGQIRLEDGVHLPEKAKVYVVVPDVQVEQVAHVFSPRLARPEQASDFEMEIIAEPANASV